MYEVVAPRAFHDNVALLNASNLIKKTFVKQINRQTLRLLKSQLTYPVIYSFFVGASLKKIQFYDKDRSFPSKTNLSVLFRAQHNELKQLISS